MIGHEIHRTDSGRFFAHDLGVFIFFFWAVVSTGVGKTGTGPAVRTIIMQETGTIIGRRKRLAASIIKNSGASYMRRFSGCT